MRLHRLVLLVGAAAFAFALTACTSTPPPESDSGLRGAPVKRVDCTVGVHDEIYVEATVKVSEPTRLIVCSQEGGPDERAGATIRLESSDPRFEPLISALSNRMTRTPMGCASCGRMVQLCSLLPPLLDLSAWPCPLTDVVITKHKPGKQ